MPLRPVLVMGFMGFWRIIERDVPDPWSPPPPILDAYTVIRGDVAIAKAPERPEAVDMCQHDRDK